MFPFKNAGTADAVPCDDTASVINSVSDGAVDLYLPLYYTTFRRDVKNLLKMCRNCRIKSFLYWKWYSKYVIILTIAKSVSRFTEYILRREIKSMTHIITGPAGSGKTAALYELLKNDSKAGYFLFRISLFLKAKDVLPRKPMKRLRT